MGFWKVLPACLPCGDSAGGAVVVLLAHFFFLMTKPLSYPTLSPGPRAGLSSHLKRSLEAPCGP